MAEPPRTFTERIIVQGGAYRNTIVPVDVHNDEMKVVKDAASKGYIALKEGGTAVDAVEIAVRHMEDADCFNAGRKVCSTASGEVELEAMIMEGHTMKTGGISGQLRGRVGDVPLIGCGGYANENGAATTSGHGEAIIRMTLAREVVYNMEQGHDAQQSAKRALEKMTNQANSKAGIIAIDKDGNFGRDFTTAMMPWASIKDNRLEFGKIRHPETNELEVEFEQL